MNAQLSKDRVWERQTRPLGDSEARAWARLGIEDPHQVLGANATQNHGSVVSQDFSLHGDTAKSYASPSSILALRSIGENMSRVLSGRQEKHEIGARHKGARASSRKQAGIGSLVQYQKSGTGIATSMKWELDSISCVVSRPCETQRSPWSYGGHLFDVLVDDVKGTFDGCVSALYGDVNATFCVNYSCPNSQQWDYIVEPFHLNMAVEQMPNEIVSSFTRLVFLGQRLIDFSSFFLTLSQKSVYDSNA